MISRRSLLEAAAVLTGARFTAPRWLVAPDEARAQGLNLSPDLPEGARAEAVLDALPGKKPLIKLTYRPPNYETPVEYLRTDVTPNDAFFVRYHLSNIPDLDAKTWQLAIGGDGANGETRLGLDDLKQLPPTEVVAVCQCAGNRRGLMQPHVIGVEWGNGAMGCARWKGVRLKDLLDRVGLKRETVEIVLDGADSGASDKTPDFVKSIPLWKALDESTLVAYEMNGEPLPHWNGFPARVVVPGWAGTYWMKHVTSIMAVTKPFEGFWMKSAYRIPLGKFPVVARFSSQETTANAPITDILVNSLITSHFDGARVKVGAAVTVAGIAWDAGYGINEVDVSSDGGQTWTAAMLGENHGPFALRAWRLQFAAQVPGRHVIMVRAINRIGQSQAMVLTPNPAGYHHNLVQAVTLVAA